LIEVQEARSTVELLVSLMLLCRVNAYQQGAKLNNLNKTGDTTPEQNCEL
jgi:hypothetical protein